MDNVSLKDHYDALLKEKEVFHQEREKRFIETIEALREAIKVFNVNLTEYKSQANEWRQQSKDRESNFLAIAVHETFAKSINEKIDLIQKSINTLNQTGEGIKERKEGVSATWTLVLTLLGMALGAGIMKLLN